MTTLADRSAPGVRIVALANERAASGEPVDLAGRIIGFTYEDSEKKTDQVSIQLDNFDLRKPSRLRHPGSPQQNVEGSPSSRRVGLVPLE